MSRVAVVEQFGSQPGIALRSVAEPHPGPAQIRVRVRAVGLNAMDAKLASSAPLGAAIGLTLPFRVGHDFAGVVDELGTDVTEYTVGDRVFGSVQGAASDHLVLGADSLIFRTPAAIPDEVAGTLVVAGLTASAAIQAIGPGPGDAVLIGGAAGGVGLIAAQLARMRGAQVFGTGSEATASFLSSLGIRPLTYGPTLEEQIFRAGVSVTAAVDTHGVDAAHLALTLGAPPKRVAVVGGNGTAPKGTRQVGASDARPEAIAVLTAAVARGDVRVPIADCFDVTRLSDALARQADGHVHGKIIVTL